MSSRRSLVVAAVALCGGCTTLQFMQIPGPQSVSSQTDPAVLKQTDFELDKTYALARPTLITYRVGDQSAFAWTDDVGPARTQAIESGVSETLPTGTELRFESLSIQSSTVSTRADVSLRLVHPTAGGVRRVNAVQLCRDSPDPLFLRDPDWIAELTQGAPSDR